jgi:hypothetical protein
MDILHITNWRLYGCTGFNYLQKDCSLIEHRFSRQGIESTAVDYYLRSGKIEALVHGLYRKPGPPLKWQQVVYSLIVLGHDVHVGHLTALSYHGYEHSLKLGLCRALDCTVPRVFRHGWAKVEIGPGFIKMKRNPFPNSSVGLVDVPFGTWDWPIPYSSAERAFIELASTLETREDILQAKLMFEGAANLRPILLQSLLETCSNIQTKRLFFGLPGP